MPFLLDTHAFIWMIEGDSRLSISVQKVVDNREEDLFISVVNFWEISIKKALGS